MSYAAIFFQSGPIVAVERLPFQIKRWSSGALRGKIKVLSFLLSGHQLKRPFDNLLINNQNPWPSYSNIFKVVAFLFRKINMLPEKGSLANTLRHTHASPSMPLRKSTGSLQRNIRMCGVIWIIGTPYLLTLNS